MKDKTLAEIVVTDVNEDVEIILSSRFNLIEIWQGTDLIEFEIESVPKLILALQKAYEKHVK